MSHIPATLSNMKPIPWVLTAHGLAPTEVQASLPPLLNVAILGTLKQQPEPILEVRCYTTRDLHDGT